MKKKFSLLFFLLIIKQCYSQNTIGLPDILNYSKQDYKAGAQNRQIRQDKKGILYFANSEGVLTFDGINWNQEAKLSAGDPNDLVGILNMAHAFLLKF